MDNKYVLMVVGGIFGLLWYWVGMMPYYSGGEGEMPSQTWIIATVIAIGLGAGNNSGSDVISILKDGILGSVNMLITLAVYIAVGYLGYGLMAGTGVNAMMILHGVATFVAAGLLTNIFMGYLKKSL